MLEHRAALKGMWAYSNQGIIWLLDCRRAACFELHRCCFKEVVDHTFFLTQARILPETSGPPESYAPHFTWYLRIPSLLFGILSIKSLMALRLCSALEAAQHSLIC